MKTAPVLFSIIAVSAAIASWPIAADAQSFPRRDRSGSPRETPADRERDREALRNVAAAVGSSRVDLQACKLEYSIVSPK